MSQKNNVIVVSFGVIEREKDEVFTKNQVISYINGLQDEFDRVTFVANESDSDKFNTKINESDIKVLSSDWALQDSLIRTLMSILMINIKLILESNSNSTVIYNLPAQLYGLSIPFVRLRGANILAYVASDPKDVAQMQSSLGWTSRIMATWTYCHSALCLYVSRDILVRGDPEEYTEWGDIYHSKPIVSLPDLDDDITYDSSQADYQILYVGGLYERKGVNTLLYAFSRIVDTKEVFPDELGLVIVGEGPSRSGLENIAKDNQMVDSILFKGWVDNSCKLAELYSSSDVLVVPSLKVEGSPRVIDEAHYYKTPVIASNLNYESDLRSDENIIVFKPGSVDQLVNQITRLYSNKDLREKLESAGEKRMRQKMKESAAKQHSKIIKNA